MSVPMIGTLGVVLLLVLIFLRVPIAVALAASGLLGYAAIDGFGAENVRPSALSAGQCLFAIGHSALHFDGRSRCARQDGRRAIPSVQRGLLRDSRRIGE